MQRISFNQQFSSLMCMNVASVALKVNEVQNTLIFYNILEFMALLFKAKSFDVRMGTQQSFNKYELFFQKRLPFYQIFSRQTIKHLIMMSKEASTKIVKYKPPISRVLLGNIRMGIQWSKENTNCFIYRLSLILDSKQTNQAYTSSCSQDEQGSLYNTVIGKFTAPWSGVLVLGQESN